MNASENPRCPWPPPAATSLRAGEVHIWCLVPLDFANYVHQLHPLLSAAERERASKFHFSRDRESYLIRHGILRLILGRYLQSDPSQIEFSRGPFGKPMVKTLDTVLPLHFNDSHSDELALYAITMANPLGVDIEHVRPIPDFEDIAAHYFSPNEVRMLRSVPSTERMEAFYACWTRKEAFLKATGEGIGENLGKIEVTLVPGEESKILYVSGETQSQWKLRSFVPALGYLGAVTFQGEITSFQYWAVPASFSQIIGS